MLSPHNDETETLKIVYGHFEIESNQENGSLDSHQTQGLKTMLKKHSFNTATLKKCLCFLSLLRLYYIQEIAIF